MIWLLFSVRVSPVLSETRSQGFLVTLSDEAWLCFFPSTQPPSFPGPCLYTEWWCDMAAWAQSQWIQSGNTQVKHRLIYRAASVCGKKCLNPQSVAYQNTDSTVPRCPPPNTPTPQKHTLPTRGQGTNSSEGAHRHLSRWYLGTGLGVVCPVLLSLLCFSTEGHGRDS